MLEWTLQEKKTSLEVTSLATPEVSLTDRKREREIYNDNQSQCEPEAFIHCVTRSRKKNTHIHTFFSDFNALAIPLAVTTRFLYFFSFFELVLMVLGC